jgi:2-polyprenyl-3-methyl-5-hydroxy-6-metoxy-1,4-benzoquinol methylase
MSHQDYYDSRWQTLEILNSLSMARCAALLEELSRLNLNEPTFVDLGCGSGWFCTILRQFGSVVGIDQAADAAAKKVPSVTFVNGDINNWNVSIDPVDVVVSQEVIEHVENQSNFVSIAYDLLKPGGYLVMTTPNAAVTLGTTSDEWRKRWLRQPVELHLTPGQLRDLVAAKFEVVRVRTIVPGIGREHVFKILHSARLSFLWPLLLWQGYGLHTVLVARKPMK